MTPPRETLIIISLILALLILSSCTTVVKVNEYEDACVRVHKNDYEFQKTCSVFGSELIGCTYTDMNKLKDYCAKKYLDEVNK